MIRLMTTVSLPRHRRAAGLHRWPEGAVVYHIYPRSFQDSNGDGIGDLPGIIQRLDYLQDLGVNAIWLSPFYPSPMADFGYDVADYCNVDPIFGTLADFKELLRQAEQRHIRVVVDLVVNHTSDEHPWFRESRRSPDSPYADWYIWRSPRVKQIVKTPNNWRDALAGGTAWEWDGHRKQFYLHSWDVRQPDLNWANKEVREAIKDVMRFWLDLGVDGFRVDAVDWIGKDPLFRNDEHDPDYEEAQDAPYDALKHNRSRGQPAMFAYLAEMTSVLKEKKYRHKQRFMVAETYTEGTDPAQAYVSFYSAIDPEVAAPFNFEGLYLGWEASKWTRFLRAFQYGIQDLNTQCIASYAFGNHDNPRMVSRMGEAAARSAALMELTLPGMAFIYYGEEIGMRNVKLDPVFIRDPQAKYDLHRSRDPERTPMQWSAEPNAGFSQAHGTWLPVAPDYAARNVAVERHDPGSFLTLYRKLIHLRNTSPALKYSYFRVLETGNPDILGYVRVAESEQYVILINFSNRKVKCVPGVKLSKLVLSSEPATKLADRGDGVIELFPHEGALFLQ